MLRLALLFFCLAAAWPASADMPARKVLEAWNGYVAGTCAKALSRAA